MIHDGRRGIIYHAAVNQNMQCNGVEKILVDAALDSLESEGIYKVFLVAFENNEKGNAFWEKQGFEVRKGLVYRNKAIR